MKCVDEIEDEANEFFHQDLHMARDYDVYELDRESKLKLMIVATARITNL